MSAAVASPLLRLHPGGDRERDGQRQREDAHQHARRYVAPELRARATLTQNCDELRLEPVVESRWVGGHSARGK